MTIASSLASHAQLFSATWITLLAAGVITVWRVRDRAHIRRATSLRAAVSQRTEELERERIREKARNQILETLLSSQPLEAVLMEVNRLIRDQIPGPACAIMIDRDGDKRIGAGLGLPPRWAAALETPHALPFQVWERSCLSDHPESDSEWRVFAAHVNDELPVAVRCYPIGPPNSRMGAILLLYIDAPGKESWAHVLEGGARLAGLAIEHKRLYDNLHFQAHHDSLTGLPNRILFEDRLHLAVRNAQSNGGRLAVLYIDVDHFKEINDRLGHSIGDRILRELGTRMKKITRPTDTIARIGGDEFNFLIQDIRTAPEGRAVATKLLEAIRKPFFLDGTTLEIQASIGIAMFPDDGCDAEELQRHADAAMYLAKANGRNRVQESSTPANTLKIEISAN